jgi:hypothetical protein
MHLSRSVSGLEDLVPGSERLFIGRKFQTERKSVVFCRVNGPMLAVSIAISAFAARPTLDEPATAVLTLAMSFDRVEALLRKLERHKNQPDGVNFAAEINEFTTEELVVELGKRLGERHTILRLKKEDFHQD